MDCGLLLKSAMVWDVTMFDRIVAPNSRNLYREGRPNDLYPYDSEGTGCIKANSEHKTPTPDTSLARANNETSSLYSNRKREGHKIL